MRKLALAALAGLIPATPALAEDGDWTGPYATISAGYNVSKSTSVATLGGQWAAEPAALNSLVVNNLSLRQKSNNGDIGFNLGYQYQSGDLVLGLEAEASAIGGRALHSSGVVAYTATQNYTFTNTLDPKSMIALKARIGGSLGSTLVYVNAGWAWVDANQAATITGALGLLANGNYLKAGNISKTHNGFIVGIGVEQKLSEHFSMRLGYDYTDQSDVSYTTAYLPNSLNTSPAYTETLTQDLSLHLVRVGVSYHF